MDFLAKNPFYTKRFAYYVGKRCQESSISDVAKELQIDWKTAKALEMEYLEEKLSRRGEVIPKVIGIDEISVKGGRDFFVIVSDLEKKTPIWFDGPGRKESDTEKFFLNIGKEKSSNIELAVMDMWKPYENATKKHAPQSAILYDHFHIAKHLNDAMNAIRLSEYKRVSNEDKKFIKGQKYTLLSNKENLSQKGKEGLQRLLSANQKINTAYLLKESFSQLWSYKSSTWARKFFDNWKASLKGEGLEPFEKFAEMVERHWDGIKAYLDLNKKIPMGFVEGLNSKIRLIIKRAYGLSDLNYIRLKILTCMLPDFNYKSPT